MPKILLGLSIVFMAATAFFGLQTKGKVKDYENQVSTAKTALDNKTKQASKADVDVKTAKDESIAAAAKAEAATAELTAAKSESQKATTQLTELQGQVEAKNTEIAKLTEQVAKTPTAGTTEATPDVDAKVKEAETKVAELTQVNQTLNNRVKEIETQSASLVEDKQKRDRNMMAKGLEGQVLAVNQGWNFVVLSVGDRQGVTMNAQMIVKRGDSMVAKIRISSVEPATSIADIVPGSMPKGARVQAGDRVIYTGS